MYTELIRDVLLHARQELPAEIVTECGSDNDYDGRIGLRISSIFVILIGSLFGAVFPVYLRKSRGPNFPEWPFFIAKYFGSGVIIATAFIHLLAPANEALGSPCLEGYAISSYPFPEGIALIAIFSLFLVELLAMRYATFGHAHDTDARELGLDVDDLKGSALPGASPRARQQSIPGQDHLSHLREHTDPEATKTAGGEASVVRAAGAGEEDFHYHVEDYAAQLTALFILEFGVIFHSVFIGLTLAVAGDEFVTLYVVLVFHQTFEGLGLGSRLAVTPWPKSKRWTPYMLGLGYALSTPIAIAAGLGVRTTYAPGSYTALITNGVFDSISAGILIYTGLVELMAHEFMFSERMRRANIGVVMSAFGLMTLGAGLMALLGYWA